jgi:hypothetical protein
MDLHTFSPNTKMWFLEFCQCLCLCSLLASEWFDRFYSYLIFKSLSIIVSAQLYMNVLAPKIGLLQMGPKNRMAIFLKTSLMAFY